MFTVTVLLSLLISCSALPNRNKDGVGAIPDDVKTYFRNVYSALPYTLSTGLPDEGIPCLSVYTHDINDIQINNGYDLTFDLTDVVLEGFTDAEEFYYSLEHYNREETDQFQYSVTRKLYSVGYLNASYTMTELTLDDLGVTSNNPIVTAEGQLAITSTNLTRTTMLYFTEVTDDNGTVTYEPYGDEEHLKLDNYTFTITGVPADLESTFQKYNYYLAYKIYAGAVTKYSLGAEAKVIVDMLNLAANIKCQ